MGVIEETGQDIQGKLQEVAGKIESENGHPIHGAVKQVEGQANQTMADVKGKVRQVGEEINEKNDDMKE